MKDAIILRVVARVRVPRETCSRRRKRLVFALLELVHKLVFVEERDLDYQGIEDFGTRIQPLMKSRQHVNELLESA